MASDLQALWGCHLYDILNVSKSKRDLSDREILEMLSKHKAQLLEVKEMDLSCLTMSGIVKEIALFESLEFIDLSNCSLTSIGSSLKPLKSLRAINFKGNQLDDLSAIALGIQTERLQSLDLSDNTFSVMPESFLQKFDASSKNDPLHINLSGNIWLNNDEYIQNLAVKYNWVIQLGEKFF